MSRTITIDPVTRIEGHAKITIHLDDTGHVQDARFHVTEFRGFEKFCEGRSFAEMPGITARICGICPVSHLMASAKAGDGILGVQIPPTAEMLRRVMNWGQIVQSHALSFYHLSGPDLLLGMESDPAQRNVVGLIQRFPDVARQGIRLRQFGQEVIRLLGGKSIHPAWAVPGGVRESLTEEKRQLIQSMLPEAFQGVELGLRLLKDAMPTLTKEIQHYGTFPSLFMGLVTPDGGLEHYDGLLRVVDSNGARLEPGIEPSRFREIIGEAVEPWSYLKFPYYKPSAANLGYKAGMYRVGPLARLNICDFAGTPRADAELRLFRSLSPDGKPVANSFHYHYARLIEILFALEKIEMALDDPMIVSTKVRSQAGVNQLTSVGVSEAPRGTLFHEYKVDENGILKSVNLIIATGQNNLAMNRTVRQIAESYVDGSHLHEGILNRIEHGIRAYDPCLSCSTHAIGQMPLHVQLIGANGDVVDEAKARTEYMPTKANQWTQIVVIGYGNTLRRDDGAGIALAEAIVARWVAQGIPTRLVTDTQLLPEMAAHLSDGFVEAVIFVDTEACETLESEALGIRIAEVTLDSPTASLGHHLDPTTLLVYTALLYGRYPRAWLVTIPGTDFEHGEGFSRQVNQLLAQVAPVANDLLKIIRENVPCMS